MSLNAMKYLTESAAERFSEIYGKSIHEEKVIGALEFLDQSPDFNAYTLDYLWSTLDGKKLGSGIYCGKTSSVLPILKLPIMEAYAETCLT
jgi:hypothetical protein